MKLLKKIASLLMVLATLLTVATAAFAEEQEEETETPSFPKTTIVINGIGTNSTYSAFKLLDSTNDGNKYAYTVNEKYETILKQIIAESSEDDELEYAEDVSTDAIVSYIRAQEEDDEIRTFANAVWTKLDIEDPEYTIFAETDENLNPVYSAEVDQGYYLIAETAKTEADVDVISLVMLDTAGATGDDDKPIEVTTKESLPEVWKKVLDNEAHDRDDPEWRDSADHALATPIRYQLTGTVSSQYDNYESYYYQFTDTMTNLAYQDDVMVYLVNGEEKYEIPEDFYTPDYNRGTNLNEMVLTVTFDNLKDVVIEVGEAEDAAEVRAASDSQIVVEYTAALTESSIIGSAGNPNTVTLTYNNNPYFDGDREDTPTNTTPPDTNIVFTYQFVVEKFNEHNEHLYGAGLTLYKKEITPSVEKEEQVQSNEGPIETWVPVGEEIKSTDANRTYTFSFTHLDAGTYKLVETTTPPGYNKADDIVFDIVAEHVLDADDPTLTSLVVKQNDQTVSGDTDSGAAFIINVDNDNHPTDGIITYPVVNTTGVKLPTTGGIGTTLFYILGGILTVGAGLLLVTKLRIRRED